MKVISVLPFVFVSFSSVLAIHAADEDIPRIALTVPSGAPLRVYLTSRIPKRTGAHVEAKVLEPVFAFDREVVPAGTLAQGEVIRTQPVSKWARVRAIVNGDFTPLRNASVDFTSLLLPDGRKLAIRTMNSEALNSIYTEPPAKKKTQKPPRNQPANQNGGILGTAKQTAKQTARDRINGAINARSRGLADIVRSPNRKEKLVDFFWSKLPYHPQYVRRGTRFDAPLRDPLQFGFAAFKSDDLKELGTRPSADSVAHVRLLTALDSASTKQGETIQAVLTAPLLAPDHKLVFPEGTRLSGTVVLAKKARSFHRPGQLRFNFQNAELPREVADLKPSSPKMPQAILQAAEGNGTAPIKVDPEGGVQARESKTRFIAPVISLMLASRAADNDAGHHAEAGTAGAEGNISGRTLGGGLGFGLAGAALAQSSRYVGMAFGYYGLAWSVYSTVVGRGGDVKFDKNAMMDIRFGDRAPAPNHRDRSAAANPWALTTNDVRSVWHSALGRSKSGMCGVSLLLLK